MNFIYEYDVCALVISVTLIFSFMRTKSISSKLTSSFTMVALFQVLSITFELLSIFLIRNASVIPHFIIHFVNIIHYIAMCGLPITFINCITFVIEEKKRKKLEYRKILYYIYLVQLILIITSPFTHLIFYFDENNLYHHGSLLFVIGIITTLYFVFLTVMIIKERKFLSLTQIHTLVVFIFFVFLISSIQIIYDDLLLLNFISTIAIVLVYLSWENPSNYTDREMEIFNRPAFLVIANEKMLQKKGFRIIAFKIHGLKYMNNIIGPVNKTILLKRISDLLSVATEGIPLYRLSSTKIALIVPDKDDFVDKLLERINLVFESPFRIDDVKISLQIRLVTLKCPEQADTVDDAIDIIESILKRMGENEAGTTIAANKEELNTAVREHKIQVLLKDALKNDKMYVVYQPIFSVEKQRYTTAEALVRLENKESEYIGPDEFIPVAEKNGLILQIGEYVFRKVCELIIKEKIWEKGIEYIHVNLSVIQCMQEKLYDQLFKIMDEYDLDYKYINLEVTETTAIASSEMLKANMEKMIDKKINFSLDDFGSGFSNMSTLVEYPFHTIKIDKSIIDSAFKDEKAKTILSNTIKMVKQLNMEIVAEGVESENQVKELQEMGCNFIQGYYYSKPLLKEDFLGLLK